MNNAMFNPSEENTQDIKFELKVAVSARQRTHILVEVNGTIVSNLYVAADETEIITIDRALYPQVYLWLSETQGYKGVHVYTDEVGKKFSCFNYSRNGEAGESSRDATLIIPTEELGKEHYVQTYYEDTYSSEFAIVATENNTSITIWPAYKTFQNKQAGVPFSVTLNKGDAYLVASAQHQANVTNVDLSGSKICSDKPIAVFNGNQQTSIPYHESHSKDYLSEQIIPITQWGTEFYLAKLGNTTDNYTILTAAYDNTQIELTYYIPGSPAETYPLPVLNKGESTDPLPLNATGITEMYVRSNSPIMCYYYTTSGSQNKECSGPVFNQTCVLYGDPANALVPSWAHRAKSMNFFTHDLDPYVAPGKTEAPKKYFVYLVTTTANTGNISIDGTAVPNTSFTAFQGTPNMSYASIEVTNPDTHYHLIESSGEGFVGMVYALTDAQGYLYTLGYTPDPFRDSLFVTNPENVMSKTSYDLPRIDNGWYQRQWDEWLEGHERLDTAIVCDSSIVSWLTRTPIVKQADTVDWYIYDVTNTPQTIYKPYENPVASSVGAEPDSTTTSDWYYRWQHQFILPDESDLEPKERKPFMDFEVHAVLHKKHLLCELPDDLDTIRTVVRVTRIYHDTIFRQICMGDTFAFFYDSLPNQGNLTIQGTHADSTYFIGDNTPGESTTDWQWKARSGENIYRREYQTRFGCDSTFTLFLFVCDTFRQVDTLHLCKNEKVTYLEGTPYAKTYRGIETSAPGTLVTQDIVDIIEAKTKYCPCQLDPRYPPFEGCDSLFEVHIFLHDIYRDTIVDTMCYNRNPDSVYVWPIRNGTGELRISKNTPGMNYDAKLRAWIGYFSDTLRTTSCPECNQGRGCDSIQVLRLIIPEPFYRDEVVEICAWTYDPVTRTQIPNVYRWEHHLNGAAYVDLPNPGEYYDSCHTRFGCDSIYHLTLIYYEPFLHVDQYTMGNNQAYYWHGKVYGPFSNITEETTLYFHNDNEVQVNPDTQCDSIYRLELTIKNTYLIREYGYLCDDDSIHWRDTVIVGYKWQGTDPYDIRLTPSPVTQIYDSLKTVVLPERDSVYQLIVFQRFSYDKTLDRLSFCQSETGYTWRRADNGQLIQNIVFPIKDHYPFDTVYTARLETSTTPACDSVLHLPITIYPVFDTTVYVVLCESEMPYTWQLRDSEGNHDRQIAFPASEAGKVWHHTDRCTLHTVHGCDSVVHLDLTAKPTLRRELTHNLCPEMLPFAYGDPSHQKTANGSGTYYDTVPSILYGCDSITTYIIHVSDEILVDIYATICDNQLPYNNENTAVAAWQNLTASGDYPYVFHADGRCDSTVVLHLTVNNHSVNDTTIYRCDGELYVDQDFPSITATRDTVYTKTLTNHVQCDSIVTVTVRYGRTYLVDLPDAFACEREHTYHWETRNPDNVPRPHDFSWTDLHEQVLDTVLYDTLYTSFPAHCDSIVRLHLVVRPTLYRQLTHNLCPEMLPFAYGDPSHQKTANGSGTYYDTVPSILYGCDSITTYIIHVSDEILVDIYATICDNQLPYNNENTAVASWQNLTASGDYPYVFHADGRCDSTVVLHLTVNNHSVNDTTIYRCDGELYVDQDFPSITATRDTVYTKTLTNHVQCDSIVTVTVRYGRTYLVDLPDAFACEREHAYHWETRNPDNVPRPHDFTWTDLHEQVLDTVLYDTLYTSFPAHCDSIVRLHLTVNATLRRELTYNLCPEMMPFAYGDPSHHKTANGSGTYYDTVPSILYGCDSITTYIIHVSDEILVDIYATICDNQLPYNNENTAVAAWQNLTASGDYPYVFHADGRCDSTVVLHLTVNNHSVNDTTIYRCDGELYVDQDFPSITATRDTVYTKTLTNHVQCDSIVTVTVDFGETYDRRDPDVILCERDQQYTWLTRDTYGSYVHTLTWHDLHQQVLDTILYDTLHTARPFYCDSITSIHITVHPTTYRTIYPVMCYENLPYQSDPAGKRAYETSVYNDTLTNHYGCDSILTVNLTVLEKLLTPIYVELCDDQLPYDHPTENNTLRGLMTTGVYHDTVPSHLSGCDSILELHLTVYPTYPVVRDTTYVPLCDDTAYHFKTATIDTVYNIHREWSTPDKSVIRYVLTGMDTTIHGCDSAVAHVITVYPTYRFVQDTFVCQDRQNSQWVWTDEFGGNHTNISISITEPGVTDYVDTMKTIYGCDSIFGISVHVTPTYYFPEETLVICQNDRVEWQRRGYSGDRYGWGYERLEGERYDEHRDSIYHHYIPGDSILVPGTYYDTARYTTVAGCDSIYYLKLIVHPAGDSLVSATACDKDSFYVFSTTEDGITYLDTVFFSPVTRMLDATRKDTLYFERDRAVRTANGCDLRMHYHLTVHPTYEYITRAQICNDETYEWRGKIYAKSGVFFDSLQTDHWHCDSVYVLELFKRPIKHWFRHDTICDNMTLMHVDTIWYDEKRFATTEHIVWKPGEPRADSIHIRVRTADGMCDSIIYHYYLKIHRTYRTFDTASVCSAFPYMTEEHTYTGFEREYDTDRFVLPYDTTIIDSLATIYGCDSIYHLHATIYPTYRHRDTITICDDEAADWRNHHYVGNWFGNVFGDGLTAGEHIFRDSLQTHDLGCDSIYELHLFVQPTYLFVDQITKCADEDLTWRGFNLDHIAVGDHFYYDSLTTVHYGCDSVYHLYLTVLDTTYEVRHDSICLSESYDLHGVLLSEPGFYKDTTLNAWGCHHFTYLYLYVIPPTVPTAWADSICADDNAYELYYTYTGILDPIGFTVTYDDFGHYYGFRDTTGLIETPDQLHVLTIPMPWRDEDYHNYPRPDYYTIRLTLDNGVCTNPDLCSTDTSIVLSYPSWVTEQRFRDVIAILSTDYNGGYTFSHYQWYRNGQPIPGEVLPYLYIPRELERDTTEYYVRVIREGETQDFQTCPIRIYDDYGTDTIAPYRGYMSVVPTYVSVKNPVISILSRSECVCEVYTTGGNRIVGPVTYNPAIDSSAKEVPLPSLAGMYIVVLSSNNPDESRRTIKVIVTEGDREYHPRPPYPEPDL